MLGSYLGSNLGSKIFAMVKIFFTITFAMKWGVFVMFFASPRPHPSGWQGFLHSMCILSKVKGQSCSLINPFYFLSTNMYLLIKHGTHIKFTRISKFYAILKHYGLEFSSWKFNLRKKFFLEATSISFLNILAEILIKNINWFINLNWPSRFF